MNEPHYNNYDLIGFVQSRTRLDYTTMLNIIEDLLSAREEIDRLNLVLNVIDN